MSGPELDPLFFKGLRLLHSKSKDSADQLKQLLDDAITQSKQSTNYKDKGFSLGKLDMDNKHHLKKSTTRDISEISIVNPKHNLEDLSERKVEKRQFEKIKQDNIESFHDAKIPKLESPQVFSSSHFSNLLQYPPSPDLPKLDQYIPRKDEESDSSDENGDADDFAMEMGLACVICKQLDVSQGNQLIECQECHSLYHQECHRPPATDHDVNDPRKVWYCAKCMKNMKKMATKTQKTSKPSVAMVTKEPISQTKFNKTENSPPAVALPFKRSELKAPVSQVSIQSTANKPIGLAGLAANFSGRVTTASSSSTTQSRTATSKTSAPLNLKSFSSFATAASTNKGTTSSTSSSASKTPSSTSSNFPALSLLSAASSITPSSVATSTVAPPSKPVAPSISVTTPSVKTNIVFPNISSAGNSNGNSGNSSAGGYTSKTASCSPLMNADKRVQIMKKKAAKLQEKRRLSTK